MKLWLPALLFLLAGMIGVREALAWGMDFPKEWRVQQGKNCVHGYDVNGDTRAFFVGNSTNLKAHFETLLKGQFAPAHTSRKVILHPGLGQASSPWDKADRGIAADWSVTSRREYGPPRQGAVQMERHLQVDVWLGGQIHLEDLQIPADFEVISGGEIEDFVKRHQESAK